MENKNLTAVEWLLEQLENQVSDDGKQTMSLKVKGFLRDQANKMFEQQIIDACNQEEFEDIDGYGIHETISKGEQYYNETFNNE